MHRLAALIACAFALPAQALELRAIRIDGLDPVLEANVRARLSIEKLDPERRARLTETRLSYYLRAAPDEVEAGLEPFGYYDAEAEASIERNGENVTVVVTVKPGEPVRVRKLDLTMDGPAREDGEVAMLLAGFHPRPGEAMHHGDYETGKLAITRRLEDRGYFDAELEKHRVEVTRAEKAADIALGWNSGERYGFGEATFEGHPFRPGLLEKLVPWKPGDPFDQAKLLRLQTSLTDLDYFAGISLLPETDKRVDGRVPIRISLSPAKRSIYRAGVSYGSDSGAGIDLGLERRWLNARGHKMLLSLGLAEEKSHFTAEYRLPAFAWLDGWYGIGLSARRERINDIDTEYADASFTRSGRWRGWSLLAGLTHRRERFDSLQNVVPENEFVSLSFLSVSAERRWFDDPVTPRNGKKFAFTVRGGPAGLGSDLGFTQLRAEAKYIRGLGDANRLLLRGELGTTLTDDFELFPPSLRFYAGGDQSVRGYGYKAIGERIGDTNYGGKHLAVASVEFERMFTPTWGGAVFVDVGDAFTDKFDAKKGVGLGLRWRSPVGPVRVDLARGLDGPDKGLRLHISIGPDL
ncbi:autotransporter assembly complex protein TamA [Arenimonas sp.]|uniref:autotransporter assembly complex protein TamA n=1 Tax=Arenimonas sp. TaxID=1872635 RepID=UPI0039E52EDF